MSGVIDVISNIQILNPKFCLSPSEPILHIAGKLGSLRLKEMHFNETAPANEWQIFKFLAKLAPLFLPL